MGWICLSRVARARYAAIGESEFSYREVGATIVSVQEIATKLCGDFDLDKDVDFTDFAILAENFGEQFVAPHALASGFTKGDCDGNGTVEFADFLGLSTNWTGLEATLVPEPASVCLAIFGALGLMGFRHRR